MAFRSPSTANSLSNWIQMHGCGFVFKLALPNLSIYFPPLLVTLQLFQKLNPYKHPMDDSWWQSPWIPQDAGGSGCPMRGGSGFSMMPGPYSLVLWWESRNFGGLACNCHWSLYLYLPAFQHICSSSCTCQMSSFQIKDLKQCNFPQCP